MPIERYIYLYIALHVTVIVSSTYIYLYVSPFLIGFGFYSCVTHFIIIMSTFCKTLALVFKKLNSHNSRFRPKGQNTIDYLRKLSHRRQ